MRSALYAIARPSVYPSMDVNDHTLVEQDE